MIFFPVLLHWILHQGLWEPPLHPLPCSKISLLFFFTFVFFSDLRGLWCICARDLPQGTIHEKLPNFSRDLGYEKISFFFFYSFSYTFVGAGGWVGDCFFLAISRMSFVWFVCKWKRRILHLLLQICYTPKSKKAAKLLFNGWNLYGTHF